VSSLPVVDAVIGMFGRDFSKEKSLCDAAASNVGHLAVLYPEQSLTQAADAP
jgi:hypothetical protein